MNETVKPDRSEYGQWGFMVRDGRLIGYIFHCDVPALPWIAADVEYNVEETWE